MLKNPELKPHLRFQVRPGEGVFLISEMQQTVLQGGLYESIVPLLDGRSVEELCQELRPKLLPAQVFYALNKLDQKGVLCERERVISKELAAFWTQQGISPQTANQRLAATSVSITSLGIDTSAFRDLLALQAVQVVDDGELQVVVTDHYLRPELSQINASALASGRSWLLIKPVGAVVWIGPLFVPGKTGCWECLANRFRSNVPILGYLQSTPLENPASVADIAHTPATMSVAWGMAANSLVSLISSEPMRAHLEGRIQTLNVLTWQVESHVLLRQPACPACGQREQASEMHAPVPPVTLQSSRKMYTDDGGHRAMSPQETLDRYSYHVSPICGAVSQLQKSVPAGNSVMHVYTSGNNAARGPQSMRGLKTDLRHSSAGKGTSDVQAKASALCEALERYSGIFRGDEPRRVASYSELGDIAIHPNACMLFSERQYRERDVRNATSSIFNYIPLPFDEDRKVEWSPVWSLTEERTKYLPTAFCYFRYPTTYETDFCVGCSNGNAAGNSLEEAVFQGFLELAERDAVSIWWYNRLPVPGVDLDRVGEPYLDKLRSYLTSQNRELWVLDVTTDLQIPTYVAVSRRTVGQSEQIMFGFGSHLEPRVAILRAVTELNQMLIPLMQYPDDKLPGILSDGETQRWLREATTAGHPYLLPRDGAMTDIRSGGQMWAEDLREDVLRCQANVESQGLEMLVLDQTRSEITMPVAKVFVPGLRHFWTRFAPGRLYDVPVKLGYLDVPLTEQQLNPVAMFL
jgi:bacteriocin biosynthesis cyclodehydratase domain-containing protein